MVKTRIQLDPVKYNKGLIGGFRQVIAEEGMVGLSTGLGPTVVGYFVQGKFSLIILNIKFIFPTFRMVQIWRCGIF